MTMGLIDVVRAALTGGRSYPEMTLAQRMAELKALHGSGRAAARAAGIAETTFRRIIKNGSGRADNLAKVDRAVREGRTSGTALNDRDLKITATDRDSGRTRTISAEQLKLRPGTVEKMRDAYLRGDDTAAAKALLDGIGDPWYKGWLTPGSTHARTGTADGAGGGPEGASQRAQQGGGGSADQPSSGGGGGSGGGAAGGGEWDGGDDYEEDWADLAYEGGDEDTDYGAAIGGVSA
jgi:hypothetical protein